MNDWGFFFSGFCIVLAVIIIPAVAYIFEKYEKALVEKRQEAIIEMAAEERRWR